MPWTQTTSAMGTPTAASTGGSEGDDSSSSNTTTIGLGVGLGVGIPLAVAVAGAIWFFTRRSRRNRGHDMAGATGPAYDKGHSPAGKGNPSQMAHPGGSPKHAVYDGMSPQEMPAQSPLPTEMASTPSESELPS